MEFDAIEQSTSKLTGQTNSTAMSSFRTLRPLARVLQRQPLAITRPTFAEAFSTGSSKTIAPFTPSISAQLQSKQHAKPVSTELLVTQRMVRLLSQSSQRARH